MSESDTFIDEVTEEVRRDRLFATMRKWGWVPALAVLLLVGGAAYSEWQKSQARTRAENVGDAILSALQEDDAALRIEALDAVTADSAGGQAVISLLRASEQARNEDFLAATESLSKVSGDKTLPSIYREIAQFKALTLTNGTPAAQRRAGFEAMSVPGARLRLMADEQLAYIDLEDGHGDAALERLQRIIVDAEITAGLRRRIVQVIVSLGAEPETTGQMGGLAGIDNNAETASE